MLFKRHFTIMVVPDAQALLRRFHIRGGQIAGGIVGVGVLIVLALSAPVLAVWGFHQSSELAKLRAEKEHLAARSKEVEETVADLRQKLVAYERRTERLAYLAGLEADPPRPGGEGNIVDTVEADPLRRFDSARGEAAELSDRSALLERRMGTVEQALGSQSERLARTPSMLPVRGLLGAGFGWRRDPFTGLRQFHRGLDVSAPNGTPIKAPADGIVIKTERDGGYGNVLYISHGDGIVTRYGHLSGFKAKVGQKVGRGDVVGFVGSTGRSTGPHLHYEVLVRGTAVDPMQYVVEDGLL